MISAALVDVSSSGGRFVFVARARNPVFATVVLARSQRFVDSLQQFRGSFRRRTHHDPVRMQKVDYRRPLAQKLRVRRHIEVILRHAIALHHAPNPLIGVDRHRALFDDHLVGINRARNFARHRIHVRQIGAAAPALRRTHRNKNCLSLLRRGAQVGRKLEPSAAMLVQQLRQIILVNRDTAGLELLDLALIVVHADHAMPDLGKACRGDKTNITGTHNRNCDRLLLEILHVCSSS